MAEIPKAIMKFSTAIATRATLTLLLPVVLVGGCSTNNDRVVLDSFQIGDANYEFVSSHNNHVPDAPCVGVSAMSDDSNSIAMSCPTDDADEATFASAIQIREAFFVIGFGLDDGESIMTTDAIRTLATEPVNGRRFFLVQLRNHPDPGPVLIPVAAADGTSRTITSNGLGE